ncbi:hypothetical protein [Falsiroseomonas tokyonensis]|uniref:Uncharacterized protein n=1 Tax=Falsiroseomonas tokyonensis TaxID=430521 RepID=A0ABV7BZA3_9PROT|nr:hypothetical protein [Falsiroseomonas tokyonensis]MBU8540880.1 hypothetical protein [Falsiroseomonas tokyonensis]
MMTKPLRQFWKSLDELPGVATDRRAWTARLGTEFALAARYLRKTGDLATAIECPSLGGDGCPRNVIKLPAGGYRAVCRSSTGRCDPVELTASDLSILSLDEHRLYSELTAAFSILPPSRPPGRGRVVHLGEHGVAAGLGAPVLFARPGPELPLHDDDFRQGGLGRERAVVLVPTNSSLPPSVSARLSGQGHLVVSLADITHVHPKDGLALVQPVEVLLHDLRTALLARIGAASLGPRIALPPNTTWAQITLRLTASETVICNGPNVARQMDPADFGMKSRKNAKPIAAWTMFVTIAAAHGTLKLDGGAPAERVKKQKQILSEHLQATFGIPGDPILWDERQRAYVASFVVRDERPLAERAAPRRR